MKKRVSEKKRKYIDLKMLKTVRAQITVFMIIGIVILFSSALFMYTRNKIAEYKPITRPTVEVAPLELKPIQSFVTGCVDLALKDAVIRIGINGGYTDPSKEDIRFSPIPYKSEIVFLGQLSIPYWWYYDDLSNTYGSKRLPLSKSIYTASSIEEQIGDYVEQKVMKCTDNFKSFSKQFRINQTSISAAISINENFVSAKLDYPLEISPLGGERISKLSNFASVVPVKLKEIYSVANSILKKETNDAFIEESIIGLIASISSINSDLPPIYDSKIMGNINRMWFRINVENTIKSMILPYVALFQIKDSLNYQPNIISSAMNYKDLINGVFAPFTIDLGRSVNLRVDFIPVQSLLLQLNGNQEIVKSVNTVNTDKTNILNQIMNLGFDEIETLYSMAFPVIIRIRDPTAFNGKGYEFYFAIEANVKDNDPLLQGVNLEEPQTSAAGKFSFGSEPNMVQRNILFYVNDAYYKTPIEGVTITYMCGPAVTYSAGTTSIVGGKAALMTKLPYCALGGMIKFEKQGYLTAVKDFNNVVSNRGLTVNVEMYKTAKLNVKVKKRTPIDIDALESNPASYKLNNVDLSTVSDYLIANLQREKASIYENDIPLIGVLMYGDMQRFTMLASGGSSSVSLPDDSKLKEYGGLSDGDISSLKSMVNEIKSTNAPPENYATAQDRIRREKAAKILELVPGRYSFEGNLFRIGSNIISIDKEIMVFCNGIKILGACSDKEQRVEMPEFKTNLWPEGEPVFSFELTPGQIYGKQNITFYISDSNFLPHNYDEFQNLPDLESINAQSNQFVTVETE